MPPLPPGDWDDRFLQAEDRQEMRQLRQEDAPAKKKNVKWKMGNDKCPVSHSAETDTSDTPDTSDKAFKAPDA